MAGESALAARAGLRTGILRLGASSVPGTYIVPDVLERFQRHSPDVAVEVSVGSTAQVHQWLLSGRVTCAVTCGDIPDDRLKRVPVGPDEIVGIVGPQLLELSSTARISASALDGLTLLVQEAGSSTREYALHLLDGSDYRFRRVWELGSVDALKRAVRRGSGVGFVSTHTIADERRRGEVVSFQVAGVPQSPRQVSLIRLSRSTVSPAEQYFESILRAHLSRTELIDTPR